jgi:hypothetical protein
LENPELQDQLNNGVDFKQYELRKQNFITQKNQSANCIWEYWTKHPVPSSAKAFVVPSFSQLKKFEAFYDSKLFPILCKSDPMNFDQEIQSLLISHYDLCFVDPYENNREHILKNVYSYISNRLKTQHFLNKKLQKLDNIEKTKIPNFIKNQSFLGYTNCKVLVILCYKKEIKEFLLDFFQYSQQQASEMLISKLDEKYDNEEHGLDTDFQVGLRFNGKQFIVKKKISLADIILTSVDQILESKGNPLTLK